MFGRMVKVELQRLEEEIVGLVGEPNPGIASECGLEVLGVDSSESDHRVVPIDLVSLRWGTDVKVLLARDVDRRLPDVVAARASPAALVKVRKSGVTSNQQEDQQD
jgi:hypothetical protein